MKPLAFVIVAVLCSVVIREFTDAAWPTFANEVPATEVNRSQKGDKLTIAQMDYRIVRSQPARPPMETAPISSSKSHCQPPVDCEHPDQCSDDLDCVGRATPEGRWIAGTMVQSGSALHPDKGRGNSGHASDL